MSSIKDKRDRNTQTAGGSCENCDAIRSQYKVAQLYQAPMTMQLELDKLQDMVKQGCQTIMASHVYISAMDQQKQIAIDNSNRHNTAL